MTTTISVEHVSKTYRLGMIGGATLQDDLSRWWAKVRHKPDPMLKVGQEHHARLAAIFHQLQKCGGDVGTAHADLAKRLWAIDELNDVAPLVEALAKPA